MSFRRLEVAEIFGIPEMVKVTDNHWHAMDMSPRAPEVVFKWPKSGANELYVVSLPDGEPRRLTTTSVSSQCVHPRYSPDGATVAFLRDEGGDRRFRIWLVDVATGIEKCLTPEPTVGSDSRIEWSRDGARLAYRGLDDRSQGLWTIEIATGRTREIVPDVHAGGIAGNGVIPSFSHDGRFIAYQTALEEDATVPNRVAMNEVIHVVPSDGGAPWPIVTHAGARAHALYPRWSPDDRWLAFNTDHRGRYEVALVPMKDGRQDGDVRYLTSSSYDEYFQEWGQTGAVLYRRSIDSTVGARRFDLRTNRDEEIVAGQGVCYSLREAADGTVAYIWSTPTSPPDLYVKTPGAAARSVTNSLPPDFDRARLVTPTHVRYPGADGVSIPAVLWLPPPGANGDDPSRPPPAIIHAHGGGTRQHFQLWDPIAQFFANRGYVVLQVNARGSSGYGREFRDGAASAQVAGGQQGTTLMLGEKAIEDHVRGADWLERQGIADGARMTMYGSSGGASLTFGAMLQAPTRFAAGCAARASLVRRVADVPRLQRPLLVLAGKNDPMVDYRGIERFIAALAEAGKVHDGHIYPDEGHGYRNPANMRDAYERLIAWFDRYAKQAPRAAITV